MKIIHTADWHIGECRRFPNYLERHNQILQAVFNKCCEANADVIINAGDLLHRKDTSKEEFDFAVRWLLEFDKRFKNIIISGNHDHLYGEYTQLVPFTTLETYGKLENTKIASYIPSFHIIDDVCFIMVPWKGYTTEEFESLINDYYNTGEIRQRAKEFVIVLHECAAGAVTDFGRQLPSRFVIREPEWCKYIAMGDIHKMQRVGTKSWYSGAPAQFRFDDLLPKGVLFIDTEKSWEPKYLPISGVKPLVVLDKIPEVWPDAFIKLNVAGRDIPANTPSDVISINPIIEEEELSSIGSGEIDMLDGLIEFLATNGLNTKEQEESVGIVKSIVDKL